MRILLAHERYLPDSGGGGETIVHRRAQALAGRGIDVRVVAAGDPQVASVDGIPTRRIRWPRHTLPLALPAFVAAARDADLIHTFTYHAALPAFLAARLLGKPVVCEYLALFGATWYIMRPTPVALGYCGFERLLVRLPFDGRIFLSEASRRLAGCANLAGTRTIVVPPGVDARFFERIAPEDKEDLVLFAGKFERRKGIDDLLAVTVACPDIRFAAIGWGPEADALAAAAPVNLKVVVDHGEYWNMLGRARVFFFPSHAETFGMVVAEAMARGCAIVATTAQDYRGIRVEAGRIGAIIDAVRRLWRDRATTLAWGAENRELARQYSWDAGCQAVLSLYRALLSDQLRPEVG